MRCRGVALDYRPAFYARLVNRETGKAGFRALGYVSIGAQWKGLVDQFLGPIPFMARAVMMAPAGVLRQGYERSTTRRSTTHLTSASTKSAHASTGFACRRA